MSEVFSSLNEATMCFLSFSLFIWWIRLIDLHILNHPCTSGMKIMMDDLLNVFLHLVCSIWLRNFASDWRKWARGSNYCEPAHWQIVNSSNQNLAFYFSVISKSPVVYRVCWNISPKMKVKLLHLAHLINKKETQCLLGLFGFWRQHILHLSMLC